MLCYSVSVTSHLVVCQNEAHVGSPVLCVLPMLVLLLGWELACVSHKTKMEKIVQKSSFLFEPSQD